MTIARCQQCPHLSATGTTLWCAAHARPIADIKRCGPKLIKAALKRRAAATKKAKLKGKTQ